MLRRLLLLGLLLLVALGLWLARSPRSDSGTDRRAALPVNTGAEHPPARAKGQEGLSAPAESAALPQARTAAASAPGAPEPGAPPEAEAPSPRPGAGVDAIFGGAEVFPSFYQGIGKEGRLSRLQQLEEVLGQYEGDPQDPREFAKYEAFKEELEWLRAHPGE